MVIKFASMRSRNHYESDLSCFCESLHISNRDESLEYTAERLRTRNRPGGGGLSMGATHQMTEQAWPLQTQLELAALPTAPGVARGHVRLVAAEWGLQNLSDTAELLVSELVANAVLASDRLRLRADLAVVPVVRLWVVSDEVCLAIHVWDGSDDMPARRDAGPEEISGRGLIIIDSLAKDWGAYREGSGKVVWAVAVGEALPGAGDE